MINKSEHAWIRMVKQNNAAAGQWLVRWAHSPSQEATFFCLTGTGSYLGVCRRDDAEAFNFEAIKSWLIKGE